MAFLRKHPTIETTMEYSEREYRHHLENEHKKTPLTTYLKEIVYGGTDGIITTFAVVAGFSGAQINGGYLPLISVILFGLANLFADGVSMALGNFLSIRSDKDLYRTEKDKEHHEIIHNERMEQSETEHILVNKGFSADQAREITALYMKNPDYWTEFMMREELNMANPEDHNPFYSGLATFMSFVSFGTIPLVPYLVSQNGPQQLFSLSILFTGIALVTLGYLRFRVTKESLVRSLGEVVILGGSAASIAYFVGTFFRV